MFTNLNTTTQSNYRNQRNRLPVATYNETEQEEEEEMDSDDEEVMFVNDLDGNDDDSLQTPALLDLAAPQPDLSPGQRGARNDLSTASLTDGNSSNPDDETCYKFLASPTTPQLPRRVDFGRNRHGISGATMGGQENANVSIGGHPITQCTDSDQLQVYAQTSSAFQHSLFGEEEDTAYETDVRPNATSLWEGAVQETGGVGWSSGFVSGSRPPPQTGTPITEAQLREGGGRRSLDPSRCPCCNLRPTSATQLPCGHTVCCDCYPRWQGDMCYVCRSPVEQVVGFDPFIRH